MAVAVCFANGTMVELPAPQTGLRIRLHLRDKLALPRELFALTRPAPDDITLEALRDEAPDAVGDADAVEAGGAVHVALLPPPPEGHLLALLKDPGVEGKVAMACFVRDEGGKPLLGDILKKSGASSGAYVRRWAEARAGIEAAAGAGMTHLVRRMVGVYKRKDLVNCALVAACAAGRVPTARYLIESARAAVTLECFGSQNRIVDRLLWRYRGDLASQFPKPNREAAMIAFMERLIDAHLVGQ